MGMESEVGGELQRAPRILKSQWLSCRVEGGYAYDIESIYFYFIYTGQERKV